jgi:hypothetical protein
VTNEAFYDKVVAFYLNLADDDEADLKTCAEFKICADTLDFILMADFVDNHP